MSAWLEPLRRRRLAILGAVVLCLLAGWVLWGLFAPHPDPYVEAIRKKGYPASLAELEAWYPQVPPGENVALYYTNALGLLTNSSGSLSNVLGRNWLPAIGQTLSAEDRVELRAALAENQAALQLLRAAPASDRCRYPIRLEDAFAMQLPHLGRIRQAVCLLTAEALMHASDGDAEKATQCFLAAGRLVDSLAKEPAIISQLVRYTCWGIILPRLERALSLTTFTEGQLAALQRMTEAAEQPRAALRAWVGERADGLWAFTDRTAMETVLWGFRGPKSQYERLNAAALATLYRATGLLEKDKAFYCDLMRRQVAALELPYPARFSACQHSTLGSNTPSRLRVFCWLLLPALDKFHVREANHVAFVRVAAAALAVERFRLAHANSLPQNLRQLSPVYCQAPPADPIDGARLRYTTNGASYAVYSIGSDASDDGGVVWGSNYLKVPSDVSFVVKH